MNERIDTLRAAIAGRLERLPDFIKSNLSLVAAGGAAAAAILVTLLFWSTSSDLRPLVGRQERFDIAAVIEALDARQIPYTVHPGTGQILVEKDLLSRARLAMATSGVTPDMPEGMELLDTEGELGRSQFVEMARYAQGLEGELAKTIMSMRPVRSARVHLAIPQRSSFMRETAKPTAAVFLDLYPSARLKPQQVEAIVDLVAGSTPSLTPDNVSVMDQNGNILSASSSIDLPNWQLEYTARRENAMAQRIAMLLEPIVGLGNLRIQVTAKIDYSAEQITTESFDKETPAVRSESLSSKDQSGSIAKGSPGIASNRVATGSSTTGTSHSSSRTERSYELDRTITQSRKAPGTLERISVGIVVNENAAKGDKGWPQEELDTMTQLVINALGLDMARGDTLSLYSLPFTDELTPPEPTNPWLFLIEGENRIYVLIGAGILALLLLILVLRITFYRKQVRRERLRLQQAQQEAQARLQQQIDAGRDTHDVEFLPSGDARVDKIIESARQFAISHPKQVAMLMEKWIEQR